MNRGWWLVLVLAPCVAWAAPRFDQQLDPSRDRVVQRVVVPSREQPQGEVQIVRRGERLVVQTLLASRVLKRVAAAIAAKEERRWPPDSDGHAGSLRYREALHQAVGQAWEAFLRRTDRQESRQFLAIEFITDGRQSLVALSLPTLAGEAGGLRVEDKQVLEVWSAPRDYVVGNSASIVADNFELSEEAAAAWLEEVRRRQ